MMRSEFENSGLEIIAAYADVKGTPCSNAPEKMAMVARRKGYWTTENLS